jgi:hypothetical protein
MRARALVWIAAIMLASAAAGAAEAEKTYGYLGVGLGRVPGPLADQLGLDKGEGVLVTGVADGSPAQAAGFEVNDVIVKVDDQIILAEEQLRKLIGHTEPGMVLNVVVVRKAKRQTLTAKLGETDRAPAVEPAAGGPPGIVMMRQFGPDDRVGNIRIRGPNGTMTTLRFQGDDGFLDRLKKMEERGLVTPEMVERMKKAMGLEAERGQPGAERGEADARLKKPVSFDFVETPLVGALRFLHNLSGVNQVIDPVLRKRNPPVTLRVKEMPCRDGLRWLARLAEADIAVVHGTLAVGGPAFLKRFKALEPVSVPVRADRPALKAALQKPVSFDFVSVKLEDAAAFLRKLLDINVILMPEAQGRRFDLRLHEAPAGLALACIGLMTDCDVVVKGGAVLFSPRAKAGAGAGKAGPGGK